MRRMQSKTEIVSMRVNEASFALFVSDRSIRHWRLSKVKFDFETAEAPGRRHAHTLSTSVTRVTRL